MTSEWKNPNPEKIKETLLLLTDIESDSITSNTHINFLEANSERFVELYHEDGMVASLTHNVLLNRNVAHCFCLSLRYVRKLWEIIEVQDAFAVAIRKGHSLLVDAMTFIPNYRSIPFIQEALAGNIRIKR